MKVPARKICFSFTRCAPFFFVFSLASKRPHKKSRRAFASRSLRLVESSTLVFDLTARSLPCRRARFQKETQRERERERENLLRGETSIFELNKKILWKSTRAKTDHGVEGNRVARPRRVALLLERRGRQRNSGRIREGAVRAEENVYDGEAAFKAAAALTEAKGEAEKNERRNGARQTAERDAREKFGTERTIGSNAAEYAKRSAIESISSTCSERPRGHRGKRKRAYERGASSVAYRNGQTGETSQVVTACTNARSATRREVESGKGQGEKTPGDIKFKYHVVAPTTAAISTTHRYVGANEYDHGDHNFKHFKSGV